MSTPIDQEPEHTETSPVPQQRWTSSTGSNTEHRTLPRWESFTLQDRHLLLRLIVQTARRQVQGNRIKQSAEARR